MTTIYGSREVRDMEGELLNESERLTGRRIEIVKCPTCERVWTADSMRDWRGRPVCPLCLRRIQIAHR